jgi:collagen type VII alpha
VANRRISELQELAGIQLADGDLLTVVDVGEVDPAIKNKKLTISGTKAYLNVYYLPRTGGTVSGSVLIEDNLTVQDQATISGLNVSNTTNIGILYVSGTTNVTGTFSGTTITGTNVNATNLTANTLSTNSFSVTTLTGVSGTFTTIVSGATVTGNTGNFGNLAAVSGVFSNYLKGGTVTGDFGAFGTATGITGIYTTLLSGATVTGTTANFTTGNFRVLNAGSHTITGNSTISGDLIVRGSGFFSSGVQITGTISGTTITGSNAQFTNVTGVNIIGTTQVSGATVTGGLGQFTTLTGNTAGFTTVTGQTVTGTTGNFTTLNAITAFFTTGIVRENITVTGTATVNSDLLVRGSGLFSSGINVTGRVSGITITGAGGGFTTLTGTTVTGSVANFVSGVFTTQVSGLNVTGEYSRFLSVEATVITGGKVVGTTSVSGASVSGNAGIFGTVTGNTAGFTTITGTTITGTTANFASISGSTFVAGGTTFVTGAGDIRPRGLFSFPTTVGTSGYILKTNADGSTEWTAQSGGGGGYTGGDFTVYSGNLIVSGSGYFSSGINISGTLSGTVITGNTGLFDAITGSTLYITTPSGSDPALVCSGVVSGNTEGFIIKGPLTILP